LSPRNAQIHQLVDDVASHIGSNQARQPRTKNNVEAVLASATPEERQETKPAVVIPPGADFERNGRMTIAHLFVCETDRERMTALLEKRKQEKSRRKSQKLWNMIGISASCWN
jgi:hypothetical protein